ncbi:hypothetical protein PWT90_09559 [Aphanocladium album]|nr:hypothetical protein PWT90_09559 [Aphanocladium album]
MSDTESVKAPGESLEPQSKWPLLFDTAVLICNATTIGNILCFSLFQDWYQQSLFSSQSVPIIALVGGLQLSTFYCISGVRIPSSWNKKCLMPCGAACCVAAWIWCSFGRHLAEIVAAQGFIFALGAAVMHATMANCAAERRYKKGTLSLMVPSGSLFGALLWSVLVHQLVKHLQPHMVYRTIALASAVLLAYPVSVMWFLSEAIGQAQEPTEPCKPMRLGKRLLQTFSIFLIYLGICVPLVFLAFWGTDSDLGGICEYLPTLFYGAAILGHLMSVYLRNHYSSTRILLFQTAFAGFLMLAFPLMVTPGLMAVAATCFGAVLGPVFDVALSSQQLHSRHEILSTVAACLGLLTSGPVSAAIVQASGGGRFALCYFAGASLVLGCCVVCICELLEDESPEVAFPGPSET